MREFFPKEKEILAGIESITDRTFSYSSCLKTGKLNRKQYITPKENARLYANIGQAFKSIMDFCSAAQAFHQASLICQKNDVMEFDNKRSVTINQADEYQRHYQEVVKMYQDELDEERMQFDPSKCTQPLNNSMVVKRPKRDLHKASRFCKQAEEYRQNKYYRVAVAFCEKALQYDPEDADIWYMKGLVLDDSQNYEKACVNYSRAITLNPRHFLALNNKGLIISDVFDSPENSIELFDQSISCHNSSMVPNPNLSMALFNKGRAYVDLRRTKDARRCYEEALKYNPNNIGAQQGLLLLYRPYYC